MKLLIVSFFFFPHIVITIGTPFWEGIGVPLRSWDAYVVFLLFSVTCVWFCFQVECLVCCSFIHPGEELVCSVRGCRGGYHRNCVKETLGICNLKKFKCPQHVNFLNNGYNSFCCFEILFLNHYDNMLMLLIHSTR